jgi:hypothetical protein
MLWKGKKQQKVQVQTHVTFTFILTITLGGEGQDWKSTSSTFLFNTTSWRWQLGPQLPSMRYTHCAANINSTTSFVAGGFGGPLFKNLDDAYLYHWPIDKWVELPRMTRSRVHIACSAYKGRLMAQQQQKHILVAGGKEPVLYSCAY